MHDCVGMRVYPCNVKERARLGMHSNVICMHFLCIEHEFMMIITIKWILLNLYTLHKIKV